MSSGKMTGLQLDCLQVCVMCWTVGCSKPVKVRSENIALEFDCGKISKGLLYVLVKWYHDWFVVGLLFSSMY